jgi:30S ribosomal protein S31
MGRGDRRTKKGKIFAGSFGNSRPQRVKSTAVVAQETAKEEKKAPAKKKAAAKK